MNRTILEALTASINGEHDQWDRFLVPVQRGINSTRNATTGIAPSVLLYGFRPEVDLEVRLENQKREDLREVREIAKRRCERVAATMKRRFDKNKLPPKQFEVGDLVLVERTRLVRGLTSGKLVAKYLGPVRIMEVLGNERYRVESLSRDKRRFKGVVSSERLKVFRTQTVSG